MKRLIILAALALAGCGTFQELSPDAPFPMKPRDPQAAVQTYFANTLRDPESARYTFGELYRAQCNEGLAWGGKVTWWGWAMEVGVNAKNGYGGYTGTQPYTVVFNGMNVFDAHAGGNFGLYGAGLCRRVQ